MSETAESGYRRLRVPDGSTAWVEEAALAFSAEGEATEAAEPAEGTAAYPSHAPLREKEPSAGAGQIYVKDLRHLAELVGDDEVVSPLARALADRQTIGNVTFWGSFAVGLGAMPAGILLPGDDCRFISGKEFCSLGPRNWGLVIGGGAVASVGALTSYFIWPKRNDLLDVINTWTPATRTSPSSSISASASPREAL